MNHFLARLGRSKYANYFMPTLTGVGCLGIASYHSFGHDLVEKLFGSSHSDGTPVKICDHLRDLIKEVYDDALKAGWRKDLFDGKLSKIKFSDPPVRWFATANIDPLSVGMGDFATGVSIGVPVHYNYQNEEDLPDSLFAVKKISLFKSLGLTDDEQEANNQEELSREAELVRNTERGLMRTLFKIERQSDQGRDYIDSLLLSDNAKRYSLAKELFVTDSYKPMFQLSAFFLSMTLAHSTARSYVTLLKLQHAHVTQRIPGYILSGLLAYGVHYFFSASIDNFCSTRAHQKTIAMGEKYKEGCREYNRKLITRNKILKIRYNYLFEPTHNV